MSEFGEGIVPEEVVPRTHDTLHRQEPDRPEINPTKEQEMDWKYGEGPAGPPSNLSVDFDQLFAARNELRKKTVLPDAQVETALAQLSPERAKEVYEQVMQRVLNETNYVHEFDIAETLGYAINNLESGRLGSSQVAWDAQSRETGYDSKLDRIYMGETPPKPSDILASLARSGMLPSPVVALQKEFVHARQGKDTQNRARKFSLGMLMRRGFVHKEHTTDVLAQRTAGEGQLHRQSASDFLNDFPEEGVDPEKLFFEVRAVDKLQALGFPVSEIARLTRNPGEWNESEGVYTNLQKLIDERSEALTLDPLDVENLVDAHRIERDIDRMHAMQITQEELQKTLTPQNQV